MLNYSLSWADLYEKNLLFLISCKEGADETLHRKNIEWLLGYFFKGIT